MNVCTCVCTHVEVRGQLVGVCSPYNSLVFPFTITTLVYTFHHETRIVRPGHVGHLP